MRTPPTLVELARRCREIVERAQTDLGLDLGGFSMLDLVADNITDVPLTELRDALVVAGLHQDRETMIVKGGKRA